MYEAAREAAMRIPQDLSVVGFDDLLVAQWSVLALTTVRQPLSQMGAVSAEMVLEPAAGRRPPQDRIELPTTLTVRRVRREGLVDVGRQVVQPALAAEAAAVVRLMLLTCC
ncbi:substrate-binding domain-containing protein [Kitasatospora sp. NPDC057223]|uniref:substrate-binding domain-containing protein n=1 Tax=Kitasatospora sp. NPDC057223 TaxID=3346055 RepID=UPI0036318767